MAVFKVRMQQRKGAKTVIEFEVHANTEDEARKSAAFKFPVHEVISIKKLETPSHDLSVKVASALLGLAKQSKSPHIKAIGIFARPIAEVAVNIKEAVERRVRNGETSVDEIARSIFDQLLPD